MDMQTEESKEFQLMTEKTAKELADAFEELRKSLNDFDGEIARCTEAVLRKNKSDLGKEVAYYTKKVETSFFITKWWYKRKLQKAKCGLDAINQMFNKYYADRRSDKSPA